MTNLECLYIDIKNHWMACTAIMEHVDKMYELEEAERVSLIDKLAENIDPDYGKDLLHKYLDNGIDPDDDAEGDAYDAALECYRFAQDLLSGYGLSKKALFDKYNVAKKEAYYRRLEVARSFLVETRKNPDIRHGEAWERQAEFDAMRAEI